MDHGVPLAFGSDFPVEFVDPLLGFYASVTRQDASGNPPGQKKKNGFNLCPIFYLFFYLFYFLHNMPYVRGMVS